MVMARVMWATMGTRAAQQQVAGFSEKENHGAWLYRLCRNGHLVIQAFPTEDVPQVGATIGDADAAETGFHLDTDLLQPRYRPDQVLVVGESAGVVPGDDVLVHPEAAWRASCKGLVNSFTGLGETDLRHGQHPQRGTIHLARGGD